MFAAVVTPYCDWIVQNAQRKAAIALYVVGLARQLVDLCMAEPVARRSNLSGRWTRPTRMRDGWIG